MIRKIHIENFRSIRSENLDLGKITVLTGANNSGKSSILYGLMVLHDFVFNPNQTLEELFALPFINLGGFAEVKSRNSELSQTSEFIKLGVTFDTDRYETEQVNYNLTLGKGLTALNMNSVGGVFEFDASLNIGLPYSLNVNEIFEAINEESGEFARFNWNGFEATYETAKLSKLSESDLLRVLNSPKTELLNIDFVPIKRGFTKPYYNLIPLTGIINTEEELASWLNWGADQYTNIDKINERLEEMTLRKLEIVNNGTPGLFSLKAKNTKTGQSNFLVNEGSGTNQLVTILAKIFQFNKSFTCIDEPEIHLHPSMVRKLANSFVEISNDSAKQFLVSTHSEHFVQALLANVAQGKIKPDDVKIYHLTMTENGTKIEPQTVNEKGQVEGGLSHFYESELTDFKSMFKLVD